MVLVPVERGGDGVDEVGACWIVSGLLKIEAGSMENAI